MSDPAYPPLFAEGEGTFYTLSNTAGNQWGTLYRSDVAPYDWIVVKGMSIVGKNPRRDVLVREWNIKITESKPMIPDKERDKINRDEEIQPTPRWTYSSYSALLSLDGRPFAIVKPNLKAALNSSEVTIMLDALNAAPEAEMTPEMRQRNLAHYAAKMSPGLLKEFHNDPLTQDHFQRCAWVGKPWDEALMKFSEVILAERTAMANQLMANQLKAKGAAGE